MSDLERDQTHAVKYRYNMYKGGRRPLPQGKPKEEEHPYLVFDARRGTRYDGNVVVTFAANKAGALVNALTLFPTKYVDAEHLVVVRTWNMRNIFKGKKRFSARKRGYGKR